MLADGRSIHTIRYQQAMKERGVDLILASLERGDTVEILLKKKSVSNSLNYFFVNREIKDIARKLTPDIINPHFASGYGFSVAVSKVWKRLPVILHCLGSDILISPQKSIAHKRRVMYALQRAGKIVVDSRYLAAETRALYNHENIEVIPWGVETEILELYNSRSNLGKYLRPLKIFVPRPHQAVYNNMFIVNALENFLKSGDLKLTFPAWGDDYEDFKKYVSENGLKEYVDYYSFLSRDEYINFIAQFDIYLSASKSDSSPASLIEAMASGLLPIVANIPGVSELIDKTNGFLYENNNGSSLKGAINTILNGVDNIGEILRKNHDRVKATAIFKNNIDQTIGLIESQIADGK